MNPTQFHVGDLVRVSGSHWSELAGRLAIVSKTSSDGSAITITSPRIQPMFHFKPSELELVKLGHWGDAMEAPPETEKQPAMVR